jgi:hypothetical protein
MNTEQSTEQEQQKALYAALAKAQMEFRVLTKSGINPVYKSNYATLDDILLAVRPALNANAIALVQAATTCEGRPSVTTKLLHAGGGILESTLESGAALRESGRYAHDLGGMITYLRRYSLAALVGINAEHDDDAESITVRTTPRQTQEKPAIADENSFNRALYKQLPSDIRDWFAGGNAAGKVYSEEVAVTTCDKFNFDEKSIRENMVEADARSNK